MITSLVNRAMPPPATKISCDCHIIAQICTSPHEFPSGQRAEERVCGQIRPRSNDRSPQKEPCGQQELSSTERAGRHNEFRPRDTKCQPEEERKQHSRESSERHEEMRHDWRKDVDRDPYSVREADLSGDGSN